MLPDIISKLTTLTTSGITSEVQLVYLLAGIRKILERDDKSDDFKVLKFHCDWALHAKLSGPMAQQILGKFDQANIFLREGVELADSSADLDREIERLSKMSLFQEEFTDFLKIYDIPISYGRKGWAGFVLHYARIIEDVPLVMWSATNATINKVTVNVEEAVTHPEGQFGFKVNWSIEDKNGRCGTIYVMNFIDAG